MGWLVYVEWLNDDSSSYHLLDDWRIIENSNLEDELVRLGII